MCVNKFSLEIAATNCQPESFSTNDRGMLVLGMLVPEVLLLREVAILSCGISSLPRNRIDAGITYVSNCSVTFFHVAC